MTHLPNMIQDLGIILMTAAVVTLIFKKLKQPVVLGYLIAGFLVGPHFDLFPTIKDSVNISIWAEIGVIFMLFGLGLEFSFKKLLKVGKSASITASFEILFMMAVGYGTGQWLGWTTMDSLFLGGILSISSTTIIVRAFEELGLKAASFVSVVFGILIVEDLIAILLLVLLSSVAVTQSLSGTELVYSSLRLLFFLVLWFLLGIYILPGFLKKVKNYLSDETMLIVAIGLCLMMVITASQVGFSPALGAFVMGSILAETREGHHIEKLLLPVKDLFSAVFFVSVGMLINIQVLKDYASVIILISLITVVGKLLSTTIGALVSGRSLKVSVQTGMSLAQIGEFSFIIATLGLTLKVTSDFLYPIAVAVSAITTFTTPYLIKYSEPCYVWFEKKLPPFLKESLQNYEKTMQTTSSRNIFSLVWREYGLRIVLNSVMTLALTLAMTKWKLISIAWLACVINLILASPFLWAILNSHPRHTKDSETQVTDQLRRLQIGILIVRFLIGFTLIGFVVSQFTGVLALPGLGLIALSLGTVFLFSRVSEPIYQKIEERFLSHLTANERNQLAEKLKRPELAPWDSVLTEIEISQNSSAIGQNLKDLRIKENFGVTIALIERGAQHILAPQHTDLILPYDKIFVIGTEQQIQLFQKMIDQPFAASESDTDTYGLESLWLGADSAFIHKSIRECGLREAVQGLIVGLERNGERILSPDSSIILAAEDLVWLVGPLEKIKALKDKRL